MILNGRQRRIGASSSPQAAGSEGDRFDRWYALLVHAIHEDDPASTVLAYTWVDQSATTTLASSRSTLPAQDQCRRRPIPRCDPYVKTGQNVRLPGIVVSHHTALEPAFCSSNRSRGRISGSA